VYLPADGKPAPDAADVAAVTSPRGRETILFAEDDASIRKVVVAVLERAGYRAIAATDGHDAVRLLRAQTEPVHLALLDVVMPRLGGPDAWEQMRTIRPDLRVLFTSGYADDQYVASLPANAEVIGKPFRTDQLLNRIRTKLDEKP
jgi:DNA-binding response OmpR family regulator